MKKDSKNVLRRKYTSIQSEQHSQKYQIGKPLVMMVYMDTGLKKIRFHSRQTGI